jgi:hypothetical protein
MKINELGVWFRTRILKTPFGDQCLCMSKNVFDDLGGYPTDVLCGEDHMLIRKARRKGVHIVPIKAKVQTSARKYLKNGWAKTTFGHLYLWRKQVLQDRNITKGGVRN